jgi:hypothetical protein
VLDEGDLAGAFFDDFPRWKRGCWPHGFWFFALTSWHAENLSTRLARSHVPAGWDGQRVETNDATNGSERFVNCCAHRHCASSEGDIGDDSKPRVLGRHQR